MLGIGDCVADHALEERLQDTAGFFVDHCAAVSLAPWGLRSAPEQGDGVG